jgi:UDP-N-acetyl-D-mannosaminuronate dehydrogenase
VKKVVSIVVGLGEVGSALLEILKEKQLACGHDPFKDVICNVKQCDALHICFPYDENFVFAVKGLIVRFAPELVIIHSSVPVGTTRKIPGVAVHSPVRGKHPDIKQGLLKYQKFIGYNDVHAVNLCEDYLDGVFSARYVQGTDTTELLKILSLSKYLVYLAVADEIKGICDKERVDYDLVKEWDRDQNKHINDFYPDMRIPIIDPPMGRIGGHCVLQISKFMAEEEPASTPLISAAFQKYSRP